MSQQDMDLLLWLHEEAVWRSQRMREAGDRMAAALVERQREVKRLRREVEFEAKADPNLHVNFGFARPRPCSCLTPDGAAVVLAGGFSLPLCAVHPEADR